MANTLTPLQLRFVKAYKDNPTAAAREIGCKNPKQSGYTFMRNPKVRAAIQKKQEKMIERSVTKSEVVASLLEEIKKLAEWRDTLLTKKRLTANEQNVLVKILDSITDAYHEIGDLQGFYVSRNFNLDKMIEGRTDEEKEYFAIHGYWPEMESEESGSSGSKSPGQDRRKPN